MDGDERPLKIAERDQDYILGKWLREQATHVVMKRECVMLTNETLYKHYYLMIGFSIQEVILHM